jgi:hypothetical protein
MMDLEVLWHILDIMHLVHPKRVQQLHMGMLHRWLMRGRNSRVMLLLLMHHWILLLLVVLLLELHLVLVVCGRGRTGVVCRPCGVLSLMGHLVLVQRFAFAYD